MTDGDCGDPGTADEKRQEHHRRVADALQGFVANGITPPVQLTNAFIFTLSTKLGHAVHNASLPQAEAGGGVMGGTHADGTWNDGAYVNGTGAEGCNYPPGHAQTTTAQEDVETQEELREAGGIDSDGHRSSGNNSDESVTRRRRNESPRRASNHRRRSGSPRRDRSPRRHRRRGSDSPEASPDRRRRRREPFGSSGDRRRSPSESPVRRRSSPPPLDPEAERRQRERQRRVDGFARKSRQQLRAEELAREGPGNLLKNSEIVRLKALINAVVVPPQPFKADADSTAEA